jgi:hypothetical protein
MKNIFDLREKKTLNIIIFIFTIVVIFFAVDYFNPSGPKDIFILVLIVLLAGIGGMLFSLYSLFTKKGSPGLYFYQDSFFIELSTGQKFFYKYRDLQLLGLQEIERVNEPPRDPMPHDLEKMVAGYGNLYLGFKFRTGVKIPEISVRETNFYSVNRLMEWQDTNKMDLYYPIHSNLDPSQRLKFIQYLAKTGQVEVVPLPPLMRK